MKAGLLHKLTIELFDRLLILQGFSTKLSAMKSRGVTPLQTAVRFAASRTPFDPPVINFLLDIGADVNAPGGSYVGCYRRTVLQMAASLEPSNATHTLVDRLLGLGADMHAPPSPYHGITALQGAAIQGNLRLVERLLSLGADVNAPPCASTEGRTALEGAAEHGRLDTVQYLINARADTHLPGSKTYRRAEWYARREGHFAVADLLKSHFEESAEWFEDDQSSASEDEDGEDYDWLE